MSLYKIIINSGITSYSMKQNSLFPELNPQNKLLQTQIIIASPELQKTINHKQLLADKKPDDKKNPSGLKILLYVTLGIAGISIIGYLGYKIFKSPEPKLEEQQYNKISFD